MNRSNGTNHETALKMALGTLVDSMESKLDPYKDTVVFLTDDSSGVCITPDDPKMELCDRLKGHWADVCLDNRSDEWYCMWDIQVVAKGFATRDEAKTALIAHITHVGLEVPNDFMTYDDENPAQRERLQTACIRT